MKACCKELEESDGLEKDTDGTWSISTYEDHWYSWENVKFCPFCGKALS